MKFLADLSHKIGKKEVKDILEMVGLGEVKNKKVKNYSLGMKQRLAIAQTIMEKQTILILDEPMNGLDKKGVSQMREIFLEYKKAGNSILMATHNPQDVEILCDHVYEMDDGVIEKIY